MRNIYCVISRGKTLSRFSKFVVLGLVVYVVFFFLNPVRCQSFETLPYNKACFLTTHNSYNCSRNGFLFPNQKFNINQQLTDGVRALMLDVYEMKGKLYVYHANPILGKQAFSDVLTDVRLFLDSDSSAIISLLLENYVSADQIQRELLHAGLWDYIFYAESISQWPVLQQLIDNNTRLFVFNDACDSGNREAKMFYMWDYMTETHFSVKKAKDFTCVTNRGNRNNPLFILNNFVTGKLGTGSKKRSKKVNGIDEILQRCADYNSLSGRYPNFIVVDFYHLGKALQAVDSINTLMISQQAKQ